MPRRPILIVLTLATVGLAMAPTTAHAADWSPRLAARYLDQRQEAWFAWKPAASADGPCVSCHTGMTYLLARPALRRALGEQAPTMYERGLLDRLRANAGSKSDSALLYVETIFTAMFLAEQDGGGAMSATTRSAFDQLWALQVHEGNLKGGWLWYDVNLDPFENPGSTVFGASLAARAVGATPVGYRDEGTVHDHVTELTAYLKADGHARRPLHDRLAVLWASAKMPALLSDTERKALLTEVFEKQQPDGGWTIEALGPWASHPDAPPATGSGSYATAFTAYVLGQAGLGASHPGLARAHAWLMSHQNRETGAWPATSMNKRYPPGSMQELFMQDAATAFAALALLENTR
jgi:hypothetical protein